MGNKARYFCVLHSWYHQAWEKRINVLRDTKRPRVLLIESLTSCRLFYCFTGRAPRWKRTFLDTNVSLCFQKRLVQFSNLPKWLNRLYCAWQAALFVVKYSCSNKSNLGFITLMQRCESSNFNSCFFSYHDEFIMEHYVIPLIFHNIAKNVYEHPGHNCLSCT